MKKIEHIGIAVKNLDASNRLFAKLLGSSPYKVETVESEAVRTSFFRIGDLKIELLEATRSDSPIARFIEKRGEGIHHLAFEVDDIGKAAADQEASGFTMIHPAPKDGADNKIISFMHPSGTNGVLIELCQEKRS